MGHNLKEKLFYFILLKIQNGFQHDKLAIIGPLLSQRPWF